jgi:hypothetical protein
MGIAHLVSCGDNLSFVINCIDLRIRNVVFMRLGNAI